MPRPLRYLLVAASVIAAPFLLAFLYGIWPGLTGQLPAPEAGAQEVSEEEAAGTLASAPAPAIAAPPAVGESAAAGAVPAAWLDPTTALRDLMRRGWLRVENGVPVTEATAFAGVPVDHAVALHETYAAAGDEMAGFRMLVFAAFASLPPTARREFLERTGAVTPTTLFVQRGWRGDFTRLVHYHDEGALYVDALESYARVLEDEEMIRTLRAVDALLVDEGADGDWRIRVRQKLGHFEPRVLRAMHDAVDDALLGHRRYLRAELMELAEERSP
jgi:hypothetical protein